MPGAIRVSEGAERRSAGGMCGLGRDFVTSDTIWQLETERIFSKSWICLGRVASLGLENKISRLTVEQQNLIVLRDETDCVRVFRNFCRHRGSVLVAEHCQAAGERLQCPYHAWTYDRCGRLVAAPNMHGVESFDSSQFGLIEIPCQTAAGFVWINFSPRQSLSEFLTPLERELQTWRLSELIVAEELRYCVKANWKLIFQNYSECYHCPIVHPLLNRLTPYRGSSNSLQDGPILGGPMQLAEGVETMSMSGGPVGPVIAGLDSQQRRQVLYFTIFPTLFLSLHPDYVLVHRLERRSMNETDVVCQFLVLPDQSVEMAGAVEFWDLTNRQDWQVCQWAQTGMEDSAYQPGPYSNLESIVAVFDRHYLSALDNGNGRESTGQSCRV